MTPRDKHIVYRENFSPPQLPGLQAWYDLSSPTSYIIGTGVKLLGDLSGNSNTNCWASGGAASNTATAPTASITGNQTLTADVQFASYTAPAANHTLFSKLNGNSGIEWLLLTTGVIRLTIGDGAALTNFDSTVAMTSAVGSRHTIRAVYTDNTNVVFTVDGIALGTTVTVNKVLANGAATATIGTTANGIIYSLTVGSVYNFQPSVAGKFAASFTAPTTGETWTINTSGDLGARICGARDLVNLTGANQPVLTAGAPPFITFDGVNDYLKCAAFALAQPTTVYFVGQQVTWTINRTMFDGGVNLSAAIIQTGTTPTLAVYSDPGTTVTTTGLPLATNGILVQSIGTGSVALRVNKGTPVTASGTTTTSNGFTLGCRGAGASQLSNIQVMAVLIWNTVHDQGTQNRVLSYLGARYNIPAAM